MIIIKLKKNQRENLSGYLFVSNWIVGFAVFTLYPLIYTFFLSLNKVTISNGVNTIFIGMENYKQSLLNDIEFSSAIMAYLSQIIVYVPVITVFSLLVAMLLNTKMPGRSFFRTVFFLPVIITSGPVIQKLLDTGGSALPGLGDFVDISGLEEFLPNFLFVAISFFINSFIVILWFSGIQILIFLAVLQKLDKNMYEAASIDGANGWEAFWKLTLPALNPAITVVIVFTVVMQSLFSLNPVIKVIESDLYRPGFGYGYSSAMAWVYFLLLCVMIILFALIVFKREKKVKEVKK